MLEAAQHFDFHAVAKRLEDGLSLHEELLQNVEEYKQQEGKDGPLKVRQLPTLYTRFTTKPKATQMRILFDKDANMTVDFSPVPAVPLSTLYPASLDPPNSIPKPHPANTAPSSFKPSPLTGGALTLGPSDSLPGKKTSQEPSPPPEYVVKLDTQPTPTSAFTVLKTTAREHYDASRARALPANPSGAPYAEVLLYNSVNELTEGTLTTIYVSRGGRWVTPPVGVPAGEFTAETLKELNEGENLDEGELRKPFAGRWGHSVRSAKVGAGGQRGTSRRWALKKGFCMEEPVSVSTVEVGEGVWVSNGVRGFAFGRVVE